MPDHLHLVWMGMRRESDQFNAMRFLRRQLGPMLKPYKFQHQAHDHVLREDEPGVPFDPERALQNAPQREGSFFKVPPVLDQGSGA